MTEITDRLDEIIKEFVERDSFRPIEFELDEASVPMFVKFNGNPIRFLPKMFVGHWEVFGVHPRPGPARILRIIVDGQTLPRVIVRQGPSLFIYTGLPIGE